MSKNIYEKVDAMLEIVGVRFKTAGKIYFFNPCQQNIEKGMHVIVETARGIECGICEKQNCLVPKDPAYYPLRNIIRIATPDDMVVLEENKKKEKAALKICQEKITNYGIKMKLVETELTFDHAKIIFYFTADGRIDFRDLVKELASVFRMRIELRQIGVRDESKILNGIGTCGRSLCCSTFLDEFHPVSIKMAKDQNLPLNPTKLSGACGRLMCCLKYEEETYEELNKNMPNVGDTIKTELGQGEVLSVSVLRQQVKVAIRKNVHEPPIIDIYNVDEIKIVRRAQVI